MPHRFGSVFPLFLLLLFSLTLFAWAASPRIRNIRVVQRDVFETGSEWDHRFPYALANKLHILTRESTVRNELLFREGDEIDPARLKETERLLRRRGLFRRATVKVEPVQGTDKEVDILVETDDVWTTSIQANYGLAAGVSSYSLGIEESNFLGLGQQVGVFVDRDLDRVRRGAFFEDPNVGGQHLKVLAGYGSDDKGAQWEVGLERPFYSVFSEGSWGGSVHRHDDEDRLFENGKEVASFRHLIREQNVYVARRLQSPVHRVNRLRVSFEPIDDTFGSPVGPASPVLPARRRRRPVYLGLQSGPVNFSLIRGVYTFDRDEDVPTEPEWTLEGGPSLTAWGADVDGAHLRARWRWNVHAAPKRLWVWQVAYQARWERGRLHNAELNGHVEPFFIRWKEKNTARVLLDYKRGLHLDPEREYLLGGENGLRGYSVRQFSGSNKVWLMAENRRDLVYDWLSLADVGVAAFVDTGAAWEGGWKPGAWREWKSDVGVGVRLAPSRSTNPGLIRIDLAYALNDNRRSSRWVLNIGADIHFETSRPKKYRN